MSTAWTRRWNMFKKIGFFRQILTTCSFREHIHIGTPMKLVVGRNDVLDLGRKFCLLQSYGVNQHVLIRNQLPRALQFRKRLVLGASTRRRSPTNDFVESAVFGRRVLGLNYLGPSAAGAQLFSF